MKRVILRPLARSSWAGVKKYKNCHEDLSSYWTRSGRLYTGLMKADEERLGKALGLDLSAGSEFWTKFFIRTGVDDIYLDVEDPMDELKFLFLKNHKRVKSSLMENKATANFVLLNKDDEAKRSNLFNKVKRRAMREFDKLSGEDIRKVLRLFGHSAESLSTDVAEDRLFRIVEDNPQMFLDKWVDNKQRETEVLLEKALAKNIIRKSKNIFRYGTDIIAHNSQEAIDFLDSPKNQDIKIAIMKQLDAKVNITGTPVKDIDDDISQVSGSEVDLPETNARATNIDENLEVEDEFLKAATPTKKGDTI